MRPIIVCLCGASRFALEFARANMLETLAGRIVLTLGVNLKVPGDLAALALLETGDPRKVEAVKDMLDELHLRKIDLADEILVLNVKGYIGASTRAEIAHAVRRGKPVRYLSRCVSRGPTCSSL